MRKKYNLYRALNKGGIVTPDQLQRLILFAEQEGNKFIHLGSRQDILFYLSNKSNYSEIENLALILHKESSGIQNIVSSHVCVDILASTNWVHSGTYLNIINSFKHNHKLRINIVDPMQNMVPLFYGHINFVASEMPNYWFLYINLKHDKDPQLWKGMVFSDDISEFAKELETLIINDNIFETNKLKKKLATSPLIAHTLKNAKEIELPKGFFPYYEGLNKIDGKDLFWAGFYWRNNQYPIKFLKEVCELCKISNVSQISFTPWKTFLIKDIEQKHKVYWDELIGRYGINMRHSSFELNWHLPLLDSNALKLKRYIVSEFDKLDIRTFGLSFSIQNSSSEKFTTVVIRSNSRLPFLGRFDFTMTYSIEYAYDFNPNNNQYIEYAHNLSKHELSDVLNEISKKYYAQLFAQNSASRSRRLTKDQTKTFVIYQCKNCETVYDERFGDTLAEIKPGVAFNKLPENYACQLCEAPKSVFNEIKITEPIS